MVGHSHSGGVVGVVALHFDSRGVRAGALLHQRHGHAGGGALFLHQLVALILIKAT